MNNCDDRCIAVPLPPCAIVELARLRLGQRDQFAQRLGADRRVADDHERNRREHGHRLEVLHRVERHLRVQAHVGRQRTGRAHAQRVAVGRRLRHHREPDVAARARPVVHHHLLAELVVQARHQRTHHRIGTAAGRERDDHADRLVRVVGLRQSRTRRAERQQATASARAPGQPVMRCMRSLSCRGADRFEHAPNAAKGRAQRTPFSACLSARAPRTSCARAAPARAPRSLRRGR